MGFVNFGLGASGISQIVLSGGRVKEGGRGGSGMNGRPERRHIFVAARRNFRYDLDMPTKY